MNAELTNKSQQALSSANSRAQIWTMPTNEEIVVARQSRDLLAGGK